MNTQTITIQAPAGYELDNSQPGQIKFKEKPKDVLERIITDASVFADNGITEEKFFETCKGLDQDEVATRFIKLLRKSLHGGEDWIAQDGDVRYEPYFTGGSSGFRFSVCDGWNSNSRVGSRLCFKERRLAEHAGKVFTKWYKQAIYPQLTQTV